MQTCDVLKTLREKHNLTQDQMAERVMVTRQAVSRWETGETQPNTDTLKLLSKELLLHKSINASLNDSLYSDKLPTYCSNEGNIYTESLGESAYQNNPRFLAFIRNNDLDFKAYSAFGKEEIKERNALFAKLVKIVWNDQMMDVDEAGTS